MIDVCELLTYERREFCDKLVEVGDTGDSMYIILDGHIDFTIDLIDKELSGKDIDQLCYDL